MRTICKELVVNIDFEELPSFDLQVSAMVLQWSENDYEDHVSYRNKITEWSWEYPSHVYDAKSGEAVTEPGEFHDAVHRTLEMPEVEEYIFNEIYNY